MGAVGERDRERPRCSTSRIVTPSSRIAPSVSNSVSTTIGASPSDGSSSSSTSGRAIERAGDRELLLLAARERPGVALRELADHREQARDPGEVVGDAVARRAAPTRPSRRFSSTVSEAKMWRPSGTSATPERATSSGRPRSGAPREQDLAAPPAGTTPMIACSVVDLPAPFGPDQADDLALLELQVEAAHGRHAAVAHVDARSSSSGASGIGGLDLEVPAPR